MKEEEEEEGTEGEICEEVKILLIEEVEEDEIHGGPTKSTRLDYQLKTSRLGS